MSVKKAASVSLVLLLLTLTIGNMNVVTSNDTVNEDLVFTPSQYTDHDPIVIESDADFIEQSWPGNGTEDNPYIIQGAGISRPIAIIGTAINIRNTTSHFVISDWWINSSTGSPGILIHDVSNGVVSNNAIIDSYSGIYLVSSNSCTLTNNTIKTCNIGIDTSSSSHNLLDNNSIINCISSIEFKNTNLTTVRNNSLRSYEGSGIAINWQSMNNSIIYNNFGCKNEVNAIDDGIYNAWDDGVATGNFWIDYYGSSIYEIDGTASSIDYFPKILEGDYTGPTFTHYGGYLADYGQPFYSYSVSVEVTDPSGVAEVYLVKSGDIYESGYNRWNWYRMVHNSTIYRPNRYTYTFYGEFTQGFSFYFYHWAIDNFENIERTPQCHISFGFIGYPPPSNESDNITSTTTDLNSTTTNLDPALAAFGSITIIGTLLIVSVYIIRNKRMSNTKVIRHYGPTIYNPEEE